MPGTCQVMVHGQVAFRYSWGRVETTVPAVNSALHRARAAMKEHLPARRTEWPSDTDATVAERELLDRYVAYGETRYVRRPGDDHYAPLAIDVLRITDGAVSEIVTFDGAV